MKFHVYTDSGHGWASVKRSLLTDLGIADKVSRYSFQRGYRVYLEEDFDLPLLINALVTRGINPEWVEHHTDRRSPIRSYDRYQHN